MRHLHSKHLRELAVLCGGMILLLVVAVAMSGKQNENFAQVGGIPQAAATALGDQQGVPPGATGQTYPGYTRCAVNISCSNYGYDNGTVMPLCSDVIPYGGAQCNGGDQPSYPNYDTFYSGVFSAHPTGSTAGQTAYISSNYVAAYAQVGPDVGPSIYVFPSYSCSSYAVPPGYDYVDFNNQNHLPTGDCYAFKNIPTTLGSGVSTAGTAPTVAAGGQLTLEWSCLPSREVDQMSHQSGSWQNLGAFFTINPLTTSTTGGGTGFSTGGAFTGTQTITAPSSAGTYNYTLTCNSSWALPTMTIPVTVTAASDNCPTAAPVATTQSGSGRQIGTGTYNIQAQGFNFCVTNNQSKTYFLPTNSASEVQSFLTSTKSGYLSSFMSESCHTAGTAGTC